MEKVKMENNGRKPDRLPLALLLVMGLGGTTVAGLLVGIVMLIVQEHSIAYGVLAVGAVVGAITVSQKGDADSNGVWSMLVAFPLFIAGFMFGYLAGPNNHTLTLVLQFVAAVVSFALCRSHLCRQMLLCYAFVLVPFACFSFIDASFHHPAKDHELGIACFAIVMACLGIYAASIADEWIGSSGIKDCAKTIRFASTAISVALVWFIPKDNVVYAAVFAVISFAIACALLRKHVSGSRLIAGGALALLCCASTAVFPAMAMPVAGMLLSFLILDFVDLTFFSAAFIGGISYFYYDLDMLLINKSYLLMASGALFLLMFFFIKRVTR